MRIIDLMLEDTNKALAEKNITAEYSKSAKEFLLEKGTDLKYGARPLRRAIQRYIEDELSEKILKSEIKNGDKVIINYKNDVLTFDNH